MFSLYKYIYMYDIKYVCVYVFMFLCLYVSKHESRLIQRIATRFIL